MLRVTKITLHARCYAACVNIKLVSRRIINAVKLEKHASQFDREHFNSPYKIPAKNSFDLVVII